MDNHKKGLLFIFISSLMFASYGIWSRLMGESFGVFYQGWTRALIISVILLPILLWNKQIVPVHRKDWGWMAAYLVFTSLTQAPLFYAFNHMDIGSATLLFFVTMLLTMYVVGVLFLKEKLTLLKAASFLIAIAGMYFVFSFSLLAFTLFAALMAILNGVASGGEVSFSKKLSGKYSALYLTWLSWMIIVLTNAPISLLLGEVQHVPSFTVAWLYQLGYAIAGVLGFYLIIKGLQYTEASVGGLIGLLEIVFSIGFGILLFGEELTYKVAMGAFLILAAAALPHIHELVQSRHT